MIQAEVAFWVRTRNWRRAGGNPALRASCTNRVSASLAVGPWPGGLSVKRERRARVPLTGSPSSATISPTLKGRTRNSLFVSRDDASPRVTASSIGACGSRRRASTSTSFMTVDAHRERALAGETWPASPDPCLAPGASLGAWNVSRRRLGHYGCFGPRCKSVSGLGRGRGHLCAGPFPRASTASLKASPRSL